jgi:hypothetical protein
VSRFSTLDLCPRILVSFSFSGSPRIRLFPFRERECLSQDVPGSIFSEMVVFGFFSPKVRRSSYETSMSRLHIIEGIRTNWILLGRKLL